MLAAVAFISALFPSRSYGLAELLLKPVDNIFHLQIMILSF